MTSSDIKILLVDDDSGHAELVKTNLARSGITNEVTHFSNGRRALDFLSQDIFHNREHHKYVVILDINMPGLNGHQVLERIKGDARIRAIPVIMLTTAEDEKEISQCYAMGCNFYMTKPMGYDDFCHSIHQLGQLIQKAKIPGLTQLAA